MTTTTTSLSAAFALTLALGLGLGACTSSEDSESPAQPTAQETAAPPADGETSDLTSVALQAIATAREHAGGVAYEIDDQDSDGSWEVDVAVDGRSIEVSVDADGQSVVGTDDDDLDGEDRAALEAATITLAEAIELAIAEVGGVLDDAELDGEDGTPYWEVSLDGTDRGDDVEVKVSVTGEILEIDD